MENHTKAPVLFVGHGSPMNAIGENRARNGWKKLAETLRKPRLIVAVSSHWQTKGIRVRTAPDNPQINDMFGFPRELYQVHYSPNGSEQDAVKVMHLLDAKADNRWGIDHGIWTVLCNLFPEADVPVVMVSVDADAPAAAQAEAGRRLSQLREEGAMILCSGNVVHNLGMVRWDMTEGYDWADSFDGRIRESVLAGDHAAVLRYPELPESRLAVPTAEHFVPLLTALGAAGAGDRVAVFNDYRELGSMSMTSYLFEA